MGELYDLALANNGTGILFSQASSIHGCGLFTNQQIPTHTILCRRLGLRAELSRRDKRAIIGIDGLDPATPADAVFKNINHSCSPNAFLSDTGCLISAQTIPEGTEITVDYGPLLNGSNWTSVCSCGAIYCRHIIRSSNEH